MAARRNFFDAYASDSAPLTAVESETKLSIASSNKQKLLDYIQKQIVGINDTVDTPFGARRITYADWTASGRSLTCLEVLHKRSDSARLILFDRTTCATKFFRCTATRTH